MSNIERLHFHQTIGAIAPVVWDTVISAESFENWYSAFCEGAHFEGSWNHGDKIMFLDAKRNGMAAEIAGNRRYEFLSIRHYGYVVEGVVDTHSEDVRAWAPVYENFSFRENPSGTDLIVDCEVVNDYVEMMRRSWPNALERLKRLCEQRKVT